MIQKLIKTLAQPHIIRPHPIIEGTVTKVDKNKYIATVSPNDGTPDLLDVALQATEQPSNKGIVVIPKVGSDVLVAIQDDDYTSSIIHTTAIESIIINIQEQTLTFDEKGLSLASATTDLHKELNQIISQIEAIHDLIAQPIYTSPAGPVSILPNGIALSTQYKTQLQTIKTKLNTLMP